MKYYNQIESKINNLSYIKKYLNIYFYETLSMINIQNKFLQNKLIDVHFIKTIYQKINLTYKIQPFFYNALSKKNNCLYVYIAEELKLMGISHAAQEMYLLNNLKPNDYLIIIGNHAINFANVNNKNFILSFPKNNLGILDELKTLIFEYYLTNKIGSVKFVFSSNKIIDNAITILPMNQLKIKFDFELKANKNKFEIDQISIYPNLEYFLEQLGMIYINNIIHGLLTEASSYILKQRLINIQNNINQIDKRIADSNYEMNKLKYNEINSDILLTAQNIE